MNFLIYGNDDVLIEKMTKKIIEKETQEVDVVYNDLEKMPLFELVKDAITPSFFSNKKIIVAKNAYFLGGEKKKVDFEESFEEIEEYLSQKNEEVIIIFTLKTLKLDSRKKITKLFLKNTKVFKMDDPSQNQLYEYARKVFDNNEVVIEKEALHELINRVKTLSDLKMETQKLLIYGNHIKKEDVSFLVGRKLEDNIFELSDAIVEKDLTKVFNLYYDLKKTVKEPIIFLGVLAKQFRFLHNVISLKEKKFDHQMISNELSAHPYKVKLSYEKTNTIEKKDLEDYLTSLANLDYQIKNGLVERFIGFELFLIKSCL